MGNCRSPSDPCGKSEELSGLYPPQPYTDSAAPARLLLRSRPLHLSCILQFLHHRVELLSEYLRSNTPPGSLAGGLR